MEEEFAALQRNHTWDLILFYEDMNLIGCKWVFRVKYNHDGTVVKHKAWFVAKGFFQTPGVDYVETFSPIVKALIIRVLFTLTITFGWDI